MLSFIMRTFALSFSIFWRALPAWFVLAGVLYVLGNFLSASPILFGLLLMVAAGTIMVFMIFVHIRSGLLVADAVNPTDIGKLFWRSFKFFRFFAFFNATVSVLSFICLVIAARVGLFDIDIVQEALLSGDADQIEEALQMFASPTVYAYFTVTQVLSQLAYAAIAVPIAANAAACTPKARDFEIFYGFGAFTLRMFLLNVLSGTIVTGLVLVYVFVGLAMPVFDGQSLLQISDAANITAPDSVSSYLMIAVLVFLPIAGFVWMVSLWCAGATLCFVEHRDRLQVAKDFEMARVFEKPMSVEELRNLRNSRMQSIPT